MGLRILSALLAAAAAILGAAVAQGEAETDAFSADPFSALVGRRQPAAERAAASSAVERFVVTTDSRVFLFQGDVRYGRLKFLCGDGDPRLDCVIDEETPAEEIHLLQPARVSRGDVLWTDRRGRTLMRVAAYGGVTVFWPGDARGQAASKSFGEDPPLVLDFAPIETARARAQRATALVSARVGAPIVFDIGSPAPDAADGASVLADAVVRVASGMYRVAADPIGARVIGARIRRVEFEAASAAGLGMKDGVLTVGYNPGLDVEGRPSSGAVVKFLEDSL